MSKNILLFHIAGLGDFVESLPVIKAIKESYKEYNIFLVVADKVYDYAKKFDFVNKIYSWPTSKGHSFTLFGLFYYLKVLFELKKYKFEIFVNFHEIGSEKGALLLKFIINFLKPKKSIGRNTNGLGEFFDIKIADDYCMKKSQYEFYWEIVKSLGVKSLPEENVLYGQELQFKIEIDLNKNFVGFGIGSDRNTRLWKIDNYTKVLKYLVSKDYIVFLFGTYKHYFLAKEIVEKLKGDKIINLCGKTSVAELVSLIKKCKFVISVNTAVMHISSNLGIPTVGLIGPGNPYRDKPYHKDQTKLILLWKDVGCNPCYYYECPLKTDKRKCMNSISAEEVIEKVRVFETL